MSDTIRTDTAPKADIDIDAAIDVVAREMTNIDAPAGLRANVLAQLDSGARRGGFALPNWAWAAGLTVLVFGVVAGIWVARPIDQSATTTAQKLQGPVSTQPQPSSNLASAQLAAAGNTGLGVDAGSRINASSAALATSPAAALPGADSSAESIVGPTPLAEPQPIAIAELGPGAIEIAALNVAPLNQIQPLIIKDIAVGSTEPQRRPDR